MKRLIFVLCLVLCHAVAPAGAQKVRVVTEEWPPFNYTENGKITGVVTDVVRAVLKEAGIEAGITVYPWARALDTAKKDGNTLIYTIFRLPEREKDFKWIKLEGLSTNMHLFSHKSRSDIKVNSLGDAKKYRVGVTRQTSTHVFLLSKGFEEGRNLFPVDTEEQNALLADPKLRRIDLSTGDRLSMAMWLKKSDLPPDFWKEQFFLFKEDFYMAYGKKTPDALVKRTEEAFGQVRAKGVFDEILETYEQKFRLR